MRRSLMARSTVSRDADAERTGGVSLRLPEEAAAAALATGPAGRGCWTGAGDVDVAGWVGAAVGAFIEGGMDVGSVAGVGT
jgi:hypothetical protein